MILFHTLFLTKGFMHPFALCSRVTLVYKCQLLYQCLPPFGHGRHSRSSWKEHCLGRQALMAFFSIRSLSTVVGSFVVVAEYHSTSKYRSDDPAGCSNERLIQ